MIIASLCAAAMLAGCTDADRARVEENTRWVIVGANPIGPPVNCVDSGQIRGHVALSDSVIDFRMADGRIMRNRLPFACTGLQRTNRFSYRTATGRLCSVDVITLIEPDGSAGPSCGLGVFQRVAIPPRPAPLPGA